MEIEFLYLHRLKEEGYVCGEEENYLLIKMRPVLLILLCGIFHVFLSALVNWIDSGFSVCFLEVLSDEAELVNGARYLDLTSL